MWSGLSMVVGRDVVRIGQLLSVVAVMVAVAGCGEPQGRGEITAQAVPDAVVKQREAQQRDARPEAVEAAATPQILFGDLHVHTSFSPDAFIMSVPLTGGSGLHPPADACDFARYCANLDFWSINDHAEGITPRRWAETKQAVRECNAVAGDPLQPDMVTFLGWEWSQVSTDPSAHYGHKNVLFLDTAEDSVPARAIASPRDKLVQAPMGRAAQWMMALMDWENRRFYWGIQQYYDEIADTARCPKGVDSRELPRDCLEVADDPRELFDKLDQWGYESIVIPHGNAWGMNTPATTSFDKQLNARQHDPERQILFEVFSGHGNSEEYRDWRATAVNAGGELSCPAPSDGYLPCCWRAGQIIRQRCDAAGIDPAECAARELTARQNFVAAGNSGHLTVPGQQVEDWLNCGNCPDCFLAPMDHRPAATAQYALAISDFESDQTKPLRYRFGLIGSSDNHRGQAGTGYKQQGRKFFTEAFGADNPRLAKRVTGERGEPLPYSVALDAAGVGLVNLRNMERQNSYWLTGGLVAVHSEGRDREAIWRGLKRKQVYATSGERQLLWFDLLRDGQVVPMGSEVRSADNPRFRVSAVGAFEQLPGCPDFAAQGLGEQRLEALCGGECYNPGQQRQLIERIEIVRIAPQTEPGEAVGDLIVDPWRSFDCAPDPAGCTVEFEDPDFVTGQREVVYYARAIQRAQDTINAANVRCEYDDQGQCINVDPCFGDYRTDSQDDCLAPAQHRAWSSPIFVAPSGENK